jgi:hypothetical protein
MLRPEDIHGELYQLSEDPNEFTNLWDDPDHRDTRERLTLQLLMHYANAHGRFPRQQSVIDLDPQPPEDIGGLSPRHGKRYWY